MRRVMIIGQPGSGKSTLARDMGAVTGLPVVHLDRMNYLPGWIERLRPDRDRMISADILRDEWIIDGNYSATWPERLARAETLIWLDLPVGIRLLRVIRRTARWWGRNRPDLPEGCPEQFSAEFIGYIWRTRGSGRDACARLLARAGPHHSVHHLRGPRDVSAYLDALGRNAAGHPDR